MTPNPVNSPRYDSTEAMTTHNAMNIGPSNHDGPIIENALIVPVNVQRNQGRSGASQGKRSYKLTTCSIRDADHRESCVTMYMSAVTRGNKDQNSSSVIVSNA